MKRDNAESARARCWARTIPLLGLAVLLASRIGVAAADLRGSATEAAAKPKRHVVEIRGFEYNPAVVHVMTGDTVVWLNHDVVPHTATAHDSAWDTGNIGARVSASLVASAKGDQPYFCIYHPSMKGKLVVGSPLEEKP
jgi:plastocyanin